MTESGVIFGSVIGMIVLAGLMAYGAFESGLIFGLPLLTKDLIEQASRRRTYVLRVVYAAVLYGSAFWVYANIAGNGPRAALLNLGRGGELFAMLVRIQFFAIIILLPAICCGAITTEKERDTLGLLLLTKLSPSVIILEKLLSRLVTMGTYQLLSLPLFAVVYGIGGVELYEVIAAIWLLAWLSAAVAAWSIYCSAWHRTTSGAFVNAYAVMPLVSYVVASTIATRGNWSSPGGPPALSTTVGLVNYISTLATMAIPFAGVTLALIAVAQDKLLARAFIPPRNLLLEFFKKLDKFFEELNEQTTQGIILVRDNDRGPVYQPIAWRETQKKSLGTVRYLFRLLVVLEVPLVVAISFVVTDWQVRSFDGPTAFFLSVLWPIAAIAITVHTTSVLASERARQTLDVLLVAPIHPKHLILQKLAGVRRLIGVLSVPFATMVIFQTVWTLYVVRGLDIFVGSNESRVFAHEVLGMTFAMIVYPQLIQWGSFHLALRLKNQTQSVLTSLAIIIGVCIVPVVLEDLCRHLAIFGNLRGEVAWLSPVRVLFHRTFAGANSSVGMDRFFLGLASHATIYLVALFVLRRSGLRSFSRIVGRAEPMEYTE